MVLAQASFDGIIFQVGGAIRAKGCSITLKLAPITDLKLFSDRIFEKGLDGATVSLRFRQQRAARGLYIPRMKAS